MKFSIIIPTYNDNGTLRRTLESVSLQTFRDFEAIVVDDGSDVAPEIPQMTGVRLMSIQHGGLSAARNEGVRAAKGKYIMFLDSDDWIEADTLEAINKCMEEEPDADIVEFPIIVHEGAADEQVLEFEHREYRALKTDYWLGCKAYTHTYACNKAYRRSLFDDVCFPLGKKFEDASTLPLLLEKANKVMTISEGKYHYVWNQGGICANASTDDLKYLLQTHIDTIKRWGLEGAKGFSEYYMHLLNIQLDVYKTCKEIVLPSYKIAPYMKKGLRVKGLKGNSHLSPVTTHQTSPFGMTITSRIKFALYKTIGLKSLCKIWRMGYRLKG